MDLDFSEDELQRYSRHILLGEVGAIGQARLRAARVLIIGAGGLGSPLLLYLAAAGVGRIGIVDDDRVELSNLQRQVAHTTARDGEDAKPFGAGVREMRPLGADADHLVPGRAHRPHQGHHEMPERVIDAGDLDDFHAPAGPPSRKAR